MENFSGPSNAERNQWLTLILICFSFQLLTFAFKTDVLHPANAVPPSNISITVTEDESGNLWANEVAETGPVAPSKVFINTARPDEMIACPGIGSVTATKIFEERSQNGAFRSWNDFKERVRGIGDMKIELLKEAGVRLDPNESSDQPDL